LNETDELKTERLNEFICGGIINAYARDSPRTIENVKGT